jgi:hypothetical protein
MKYKDLYKFHSSVQFGTKFDRLKDQQTHCPKISFNHFFTKTLKITQLS